MPGDSRLRRGLSGKAQLEEKPSMNDQHGTLPSAQSLAQANTLHFPNESDDYRRARNALLVKEIELRRAMEGVAVARRALPKGGLVPEDYVFEGRGPYGRPAKIKLSDLFAPGKNSLITYSFMFPRYPDDERPKPASGETARLAREESPCPSCAVFLDALNGAAEHVEAAGYNFAVIANAPLAQLETFARDRQWWHLRFLSSAGNNFKRDYHCLTPEGHQMPLMTVFHRDGDEIRHFWSSEMFWIESDPGQDPRHCGTIEPLWNLFDLTPEGRPSQWDEQLQYD
jgi:predicted dithiol-disulfide oxidoreductase (DUF899 family)